MAINWYAHHLGDYSKKTRHLTILEHGAYRLLLDLYYINGGPIKDDKKSIYRACGASSTGERRAIDRVLDQFFELSDDGFWKNSRASVEISKQNEIKEIRKKNGAKAHAREHAKAPAKAYTTIPTTTVERDIPVAPSNLKIPDWVPKTELRDYLAVREKIPECGNSKEEINAILSTLQLLEMRGANIGQVLRDATSGRWKTLHMDKITQQSQKKGTVKHVGKTGYSDVIAAGIMANSNPQNPIPGGYGQRNPVGPQLIGHHQADSQRNDQGSGNGILQHSLERT